MKTAPGHSQRKATWFWFSVALLVPGCQLDPFCLSGQCNEPGADGGLTDDGGGAGGDGSTATDGSAGNSDAGDAGADGSTLYCDPSFEELCNNFDDDCDGEVDEGFDLSNNFLHCGACNNACNLDHALAECRNGECVVTGCDVCFYDHDTLADNGCEYGRCCVTETISAGEYCAGGPGADCCDNKDNDCDGERNEDHLTDSDPANCGGCYVDCTDADCRAQRRCQFPFAEALCQDGHCVIGECVEGRVNADGIDSNGCELPCVPNVLTGGQEVCNNLDDDCDGRIDNGVTDTPGPSDPLWPCGSTDEGRCAIGTPQCTRGSWTCPARVDPNDETCNGQDDDCNGTPDDIEPLPCGSNVGECRRGTTQCVDGEEQCLGGRGVQDEVCNGRDDDCDGEIDNDVTDSPTRTDANWPCGTTDVGLCELGTPVCSGGAWTCGADLVLPTDELCNGEDDDCDGDADEDFDFDHDPFNCGSCGNSCDGVFPHAVAQCVRADGAPTATCQIQVCQTNYYDFTDAPGCETRCVVSGSETCNGRDDDCNNVVDDWVPPSNYCLPYGVCSGVRVQCVDPDGAGAQLARPVCNYPNTYQANNETSCDGLDNDCDGRVDENFNIGNPCDNGRVGRCYAAGTIACSCPDGRSCQAIAGTPTVCVFESAPLTSVAERCNGIDDNCDGQVDNSIALSRMNTVEITADVDLDGDGMILHNEVGRNFFMFRFEASHPDAEGTDDPGSIWTHACSTSGRLPWSNVSWRDAQEACCGLNAGGDCTTQVATTSSGSVEVPLGWSLCTAPDWTTGCQVSTHEYAYPYGDAYGSDTCNGMDHRVGETVATGSLTDCKGGLDLWGLNHFDMSGNVSEWTFTGTFICPCDTGAGVQTNCGCDPDRTSCTCNTNDRCQDACSCDPDCSTYYEYRGGSFQNPAPGMTCQFDFNVGVDRSDDPDYDPVTGTNGPEEPEPGLALESLGFRCCYYPDLTP